MSHPLAGSPIAAPAAGSDLFQTYEQDYVSISKSIAGKLTESKSGKVVGEPLKSLFRAIEREIEEAEEILSQMDIEVYSLPPTTRTKLQPKLKNYKAEVDKWKKDLTNVRRTAPADRAALLGSDADFDSPYDDMQSQAQRDRLMMGTDRLNKASERLMDSHRIALETEQSGISTLQELRRQREQIEHTRNSLREADSYIDKAQRTLRGMARRLATNKMITAAIILILVILILLTLYLKFR
ncbi:t-SNARE [Paraphysoderma sedebokerense]|nr:t-SNARE [Paraphysoderma sedebokerense]